MRNYRNNFESQGDRDGKQQERRNQDYSYGKQNNFGREFQNSQNRQELQPRYASENTRYFYHNQRIQNTYPQTRSNNEFGNNARLNYD